MDKMTVSQLLDALEDAIDKKDAEIKDLTSHIEYLHEIIDDLRTH